MNRGLLGGVAAALSFGFGLPAAAEPPTAVWTIPRIEYAPKIRASDQDKFSQIAQACAKATHESMQQMINQDWAQGATSSWQVIKADGKPHTVADYEYSEAQVLVCMHKSSAPSPRLLRIYRSVFISPDSK
jgi:hypothetical protein